jgi:hypothetical protein
MARQLKPREKFAAGRLRACELMPYFRSAIWKMVPLAVPKGTLNTWGVTPNGVLLYDPITLESWSVDEIADTFLHEVGHLLRGHADRIENLIKTKFVALGISEAQFRAVWNRAADRELNDDLVAAGRCREGEWLVPTEIGCDDGLTAEVYLHEELQQLKGAPPPPPCGHAGQCGSGAGLALAGEPEMKPQIEEVGRSAAEIHQVKKQVAQAIQSALSGAGRGTVPAGWARWADEQLQPPKVDWRTKLARSLRAAVATTAGMIDFSYGRPSRRQGAYGWGSGSPIMPAMVQPIPRSPSPSTPPAQWARVSS